MIFSEDVRRKDKLPALIKRHAAFNNDTKYHKVFPKIGLDNFEIKLSNTKYSIVPSLKMTSFNIDAVISGNMKKSTYKRLTWKTLGSILSYFSTCINIINCLISRRNSDLEVVFSSDYADGVWDIATMSMRGAGSYLQQWDYAESFQLVESIIDPCCGIIYLTDGESTPYGSNMLYRAIVRYVIHKYNGPCLFLETLSSNKKTNFDKYTAEFIFASELSKRSGLPVVSESYHFNDKDRINLNLDEVFYIPHSTVLNRYRTDPHVSRGGLFYKFLNNELFEKFPSLKNIRQIING